MSTTQLDIKDDEGINKLREQLRSSTSDRGFSEYETTKLVTASSEIARNILDYTDGGTVQITEEELDEGCRFELKFEDVGPGIEDVDRAMEDGYQGPDSTGLGVGLPGAERLTDEFDIESDVEEGTTVRLVVRSDGDNQSDT